MYHRQCSQTRIGTEIRNKEVLINVVVKVSRRDGFDQIEFAASSAEVYEIDSGSLRHIFKRNRALGKA